MSALDRFAGTSLPLTCVALEDAGYNPMAIPAGRDALTEVGVLVVAMDIHGASILRAGVLVTRRIPWPDREIARRVLTIHRLERAEQLRARQSPLTPAGRTTP